jgi:hypothetical protein
LIVNGIRLPSPKSQSGRRLFVLTKTELWLDMGGVYKRFALRSIAERRLIVTPAGESSIKPDVDAEDIGAYERIEGQRLWFTGHRLQGEWQLILE